VIALLQRPFLFYFMSRSLKTRQRESSNGFEYLEYTEPGPSHSSDFAPILAGVGLIRLQKGGDEHGEQQPNDPISSVSRFQRETKNGLLANQWVTTE
jgi:hypothetical protein